MNRHRHLRYATFYRRTQHGRGETVHLSVPLADLPADVVDLYLGALQHRDNVEHYVATVAGFRWDEEIGWVKR